MATTKIRIYMFIKFNILMLIFLLFSSCASGGKVMSVDKFSEVSIGMTQQDLEKKLGRPYSVKDLGNGEIEYTYIQKDDFGARGVIEERHYLITIKDGKVTNTQTKIFNRPAYERNSYEMQTTYKQ
jgi:outer membrane protein assembly factor BamE (lipoprotein component of BamABCDE complex)